MRNIHLWRIFLAVSVVILIANMAFIDYIWLQDRGKLNRTIENFNKLAVLVTSTEQEAELSGKSSTSELVVGPEIEARGCGPVCERVIERKVAEALDIINVPAKSPNAGASATPTSTATNTAVVTQTGTYYIPLSGTGNTSSRDWVDIANTETVIDWSEYGPNRTITWDIYGRIFQGNGKARFRLYDKTNSVAVPGSDLETASETSAHLTSGPLTMWSGKNTYIVQALSLTGYTAYFESGRIKVTVF